MRFTPSLFVVVWRDKSSGEFWSGLYAGLDDVCMEYDERERETAQVVSSAELVFTSAGPRWVAFNLSREATEWRRAKAEEAQATEAARRDYREDLI